MIKNENPILVIKPSAQDHRPPMNSGGGEPKFSAMELALEGAKN
jgi:hypothetical protein